MRAAQIQNNIVVQVIEGSADWANLNLGGTWIDINGFSVGLGYTYLPNVNKFIAPQPYPSWALDSNYLWQAPTPKPNTNEMWVWDELNFKWKLYNQNI